MIGPFDADDNATPLTPAERDGLIPTHVTLRSELNELEQQNILEADQWAFQRKRPILDEAFLRGLAKQELPGYVTVEVEFTGRLLPDQATSKFRRMISEVGPPDDPQM